MILVKYFFSWGKEYRQKSKKTQTSVKIFPIGEIKELFNNNFSSFFFHTNVSFLQTTYKCPNVTGFSTSLPGREPGTVTHRKISKLAMARTKHWCFCAEKWVNFLHLLNVVLNVEQWCGNLALESATLGEIKIYYRPDQKDKIKF